MRKTQRDIEAAQNYDCAFFMLNPHRRYRMRRALPAEAQHPEHNVIVTAFVDFDGKATEISTRDLGLEFFPGDDEGFAEWAWNHAVEFAGSGASGPNIIGAVDIERAKARLLAPVLPGLRVQQTSGVDPRRFEATLAFHEFRAKRGAA